MDESTRDRVFNGTRSGGEAPAETTPESTTPQGETPIIPDEAGNVGVETTTVGETPAQETSTEPQSPAQDNKTEEHYQERYQKAIAILNQVDPTGTLKGMVRGEIAPEQFKTTQPQTTEEPGTAETVFDMSPEALKSLVRGEVRAESDERSRAQSFKSNFQQADQAYRELGPLDQATRDQINAELAEIGIYQPDPNGQYGSLPTHYVKAFVGALSRREQMVSMDSERKKVETAARAKLEAANQVSQPTSTGVTPAPDMTDAMKSVEQMRNVGQNPKAREFLDG